MHADRNGNLPTPLGFGFRASIAIVGVMAASCVAKRSLADDLNWPQWRGPQMTGVSQTADPPVTWSEKENIKWKVSIPGKGLATPVVWEDRVFIQTAIPGKKEPAAEAKADDAGKSDPPAARTDDGPRRDDRPDRGGGPPEQ